MGKTGLIKLLIQQIAFILLKTNGKQRYLAEECGQQKLPTEAGSFIIAGTRYNGNILLLDNISKQPILLIVWSCSKIQPVMIDSRRRRRK